MSKLEPVWSKNPNERPRCPKCNKLLNTDYQQWTFIYQCKESGCNFYLEEEDSLAHADMERLGGINDSEW